KVGVLMRPERFGPAGANFFTGEVIESVYLGTSFKLRLAVDGGRELLVRQPARGSLPAPGSPVTVGLDPDALHRIQSPPETGARQTADRGLGAGSPGADPAVCVLSVPGCALARP